MKIAILGAGSVGQRLHALLNDNGYQSVLCSRSQAAGTVSFDAGIENAEMVILAIPYTACVEALSSLRDKLVGKIVIDCTNPLQENWAPLLLGQENSAGEEIARLLPASHVVKAFNTIFADIMHKDKQDRGGHKITVFVAGNNLDAKDAVIELAQKIGFATLDVGAIQFARYLEAMAHLNIQIAVNQGVGTDATFVYSIGQ